MESRRTFFCRSVGILLIILVTFFGVCRDNCAHASGVTRPDSAQTVCNGILSTNDKFLNLQYSGASGADEAVARTHLMNEALTPLFKEIYAEVTNLSTDKLAREIGQVEMKLSAVARSPWAWKPDGYLGFDRNYDGYIAMEVDKVVAPYTSYNLAVMTKMAKAILFIRAFVNSRQEGLLKPISENAGNLLRHRTYAKDDMLEHMDIAYATTLQEVALLTAEPSREFDVEQKLVMGLTQTSQRPSRAVLDSLSFAPAVLGPYGNNQYISDAYTSDGKGGLAATTKLKNIFEENKAAFRARYRRDVETGNGCPIGHCMKGEDRPGLQYFLDSVLYVYSKIPQ